MRALAKRIEGYHSWNDEAEAADALRAAADEVDRLRAVIENAPHGYPCAVTQQLRGDHPCTCWKADV